jgi:predicted metal-binding membrane protein
MRAFFRRHRKLAAVLAALVLVFELWRIGVALPQLAPYWQQYAGILADIADRPLWHSALVFTIIVTVFAAQMILAVLALRWLHRRLFRRVDLLTPRA